MSYSFVITKFLHSGIFELSPIITPYFPDSPFGSIVNSPDGIDDDLTCFILRVKKKCSGESCEIINNNKAIFLLGNRHDVDWSK